MFLDVWGRMLGIPYDEYSVMPLGELGDLISGYQVIHNPDIKIVEAREEHYIPNLR